MFARRVLSIRKARGCVSSFSLTPVSSLDAFRAPLPHREAEKPGVTIIERTGVSLFQVLARKGADVQLAERVLEMFNVALPSTPRYVGSSPISCVWAGPSQWLALCEQRGCEAFTVSLSSSLLGFASAVDQSDGRTIIRVSGPRAREALAKGLPIDLHPRVFRGGDAAITAVPHIGVHFWQLDDVPTYELTMFRSFAIAFCEWLVEASAEFGVRIIK
jgi:heterotetrameric sarcosine oxidase gamma subunit